MVNVVTITFLLTTALIIILVGPVSQVFQALLFVSTSDTFLTTLNGVLNHCSVLQYLKYTEVGCCCLHCLQYILADLL